MALPSLPASGLGGPDRLVGRVFNNRFRIHSLLARGGMGKVYRAVQISLGRVVALKVLHPSFATDETTDFRRRFLLEAAIAAQLSHPNTVTIYDFGQSDDGICYMAMEFLQGTCLRAALHQAAPFAPQRALHIALQIASALREAHALGAIHRDLKPANIFLLDRGQTDDFVKVLDFGLVKSVAANDDGSRLTQPGRFLGSPGYMAPEQIHGKVLDGRCDVYALGVLLYEMLTGRPPFVRSSHLETMRAHIHEPVAPMCVTLPGLRVPPRLEQVVQQCLQKEANARYPSMDALHQALTELYGDEPASSNAGPNWPPQHTAITRLPTRLDDAEESGWSIVSSAGVLGLAAKGGEVACPAPATEAATQMAETRAMQVDCPTALHMPPPDKSWTTWRGRRRSRIWGAVATAICFLAAPWLHRFGPRALQEATAYVSNSRRITLNLRSSPAGAAAFLGSTRICSATPCRVVLPRQRGIHHPFVSVHFVLAGHDDFVATRRLHRGENLVDAPMQSPAVAARTPGEHAQGPARGH